MCDNLALVTEGGRGYWLQLYTSSDTGWIEDVLRQVLVQVGPRDHRPCQPDEATD